jgi:hypothetical protein
MLLNCPTYRNEVSNLEISLKIKIAKEVCSVYVSSEFTKEIFFTLQIFSELLLKRDQKCR